MLRHGFKKDPLRLRWVLWAETRFNSRRLDDLDESSGERSSSRPNQHQAFNQKEGGLACDSG